MHASMISVIFDRVKASLIGDRMHFKLVFEVLLHYCLLLQPLLELGIGLLQLHPGVYLLGDGLLVRPLPVFIALGPGLGLLSPLAGTAILVLQPEIPPPPGAPGLAGPLLPHLELGQDGS